MERLIILLVVLTYSSAVPPQLLNLAGFIPTAITPSEAAQEQKAGFKGGLVQELDELLSDANAAAELEGTEKSSSKQSTIKTSGKVQSNEENIWGRLLNNDQSLKDTGATASESQTAECLLTTKTVGDINNGKPYQYIIVNQRVLSYHVNTPPHRITWLLAFIELQQEVEANGTMDLWFNFPPTADAIEVLNIIFEGHSKPCKPTLYIKNFSRRNTTFKDTFKNVACLDKLSQDGYMIAEWNWRIFARLTRTHECALYNETTECPRSRQNRYLSRIGRNNYAKSCTTNA